jgi:hypothetical protein
MSVPTTSAEGNRSAKSLEQEVNGVRLLKGIGSSLHSPYAGTSSNIQDILRQAGELHGMRGMADSEVTDLRVITERGEEELVV